MKKSYRSNVKSERSEMYYQGHRSSIEGQVWKVISQGFKDKGLKVKYERPGVKGQRSVIKNEKLKLKVIKMVSQRLLVKGEPSDIKDEGRKSKVKGHITEVRESTKF